MSDNNHSGRRSTRFGAPLIIGLFSFTLLAVWLVPGDPSKAQNRAQAQFPDFTWSSPARASWFAEMDAAFRDRLGAQVFVADGYAKLTIDTLGRSPSSRVVLGSDGQPFFADDFIFPCTTEAMLPELGDQLAANASGFAQAGIDVLYVIAPDKSSVRSDVVNAVSPDLLRCSNKARSWFESIELAGDVPLVTLWDSLTALDTSGEPAFLFEDTHWNGRGATALTTAILEHLVAQGIADARLLADAASPVLQDPVRYRGDLDTLMGVHSFHDQQRVTFQRSGVETTVVSEADNRRLFEYRSISSDAALVPGRTLMLGDSFLLSQLLTQVPSFFEDLTISHVDDPIPAGHYDQVIVERVQRYATQGGWIPELPTP